MKGSTLPSVAMTRQSRGLVSKLTDDVPESSLFFNLVTSFRASATAVDEVEIIRLNIERFRRMLEADLDETSRRAVKKMLDEFEAKLPAPKRRSEPTKALSDGQAGAQSRAQSFLDR